MAVPIAALLGLGVLGALFAGVVFVVRQDQEGPAMLPQQLPQQLPLGPFQPAVFQPPIEITPGPALSPGPFSPGPLSPGLSPGPLSPGPAVPLPPAPRPSSKIRERQQKLARLGFNPGPIDGVWGRSSRLALIEAQKALGLEADGVWGPKTEAAINKALDEGLPSDSDAEKKPPAKQKKITLDPADPTAKIKARQQALAHLGYEPGEIDGKWGKRSRAALILAQRELGLKADGVWGPKTADAIKAAINSNWERPARRRRPVKSAKKLPTSAPSKRDLERQKLLTRLGFKPGPADGVWGTKSDLALRAAQKKFGQRQDGRWTPELDRILRGALVAKQLAEGKKANPNEYGTATPSDRDLARQKALQRLGFDPGTPDGVWGPKSDRALKAAQRALGLPVDGRWGPETDARIQKALNDGWTFQAGSPKQPARHDDRDLSTVRQRQQALRELGAYDGAIDGVWGRGSRAALKSAQRRLGLTVDGRWGPKSEAAIRKALKDGVRVGEDDLVVELIDLSSTIGRQEALQDLGAALDLSGVWDDQTSLALKEAQLAVGMDPTGEWSSEFEVRLESSLADLEEGEGEDRPAPARELPDEKPASDRAPPRRGRDKAEAMAAERRNAAIAVVDRPPFSEQERVNNGRQADESDQDWLARWAYWASYPNGPADPTAEGTDERYRAAYTRIRNYIERMWPAIRRLSPVNPVAPERGANSQASRNWHKWALVMESASRLRDPGELAKNYQRAWDFMFRRKRGQEWTAALAHQKLHGIPVTTSGLVALAADAFATGYQKYPKEGAKAVNHALEALVEPKATAAFLSANLIHL
ncbi:MAG: peptidoglycan-binding protein [Myxococcales bacterium]|nr:peptidoglycan-binding protein [Myxococcales bacterium]